MRILKWIVGIIAFLAIAFVGVGLILPREVNFARSIDVEAPADQVFALVNSMQATESWSPWLDRDPNVQLTYTGPDAGVGNKMQWASDHPQVGNGTQEIMVSEPDKRVATALDFGDMGLAEAQFLLDETDGKTTVTWTLKTDMGAGPMGRWMGLMMDGWVGGDYEKGLENLKA
ncbi:MAG: SRPBCC family protein [Pseudomonadota bacterium]